MSTGENSAIQLKDLGGGIWAAPGAHIIDRSGRKKMPIGFDGFTDAMKTGTLVDKTMLVADVLDGNYKVTLFCRPRRFGKTLNMTMMRSFFEAPDTGGLSRDEAESVFDGTLVWEADNGRYRESQGTYPVVHLSFNTVKKLRWDESLAEIRNLMTTEYARHEFIKGSSRLSESDASLFDRIESGSASDADFAGSLTALCRMLRDYHGSNVVVLIDEYDAPVMAGYTYGYYDEVVNFMKGWLTGALKDGGEALAFACLTGVQRISKESIFSDLNNLSVSTPLTVEFDERYGFTDAEVAALAAYLGHSDCMAEAREWYDGYRFGRADVYNPWSVINYLGRGCAPDVYWGNTSSNSVVSSLVADADADALGDVYTLLQPGGEVAEPLDLGVVFPDIGIREGALWSMLYLAGYLTTEDVSMPNDNTLLRQLRIPNREIGRLFESEVIKRFRGQAGGARRLMALQQTLIAGDETGFEAALSQVAGRTSTFDLTGELPCHMLLVGLLFGTPGYESPLSNREAGHGRYDIRLEPDPRATGRFATGPRPLVTIEVKFLHRPDQPDDADERDAALRKLAHEALVQIAEKGYDAGPVPPVADGRIRWGVAFCGKRVAVACERPE